jgi:hypothetical protein
MNTEPQAVTPAAVQPRVDSIEQALDILCTAPVKSKECVLDLVNRAVLVIQGRKQRDQLKQAIIKSANEAGIRAKDPAHKLQRLLREMPDEEAPAESEATAAEVAQ